MQRTRDIFIEVAMGFPLLSACGVEASQRLGCGGRGLESVKRLRGTLRDPGCQNNGIAPHGSRDSEQSVSAQYSWPCRLGKDPPLGREQAKH